MSQNEGSIREEDGFEGSVQAEGGEVPMPNIAAGSRGRSGDPEDQAVAEERVADDGDRVSEGYVRPGEPHTD